uniref:Uncharacterized protein n=1 Tax=Oryza sativa subsp. japonica TaxID=39947 RepID=Q5Z579_ORYSJ|nr:hypothetical protein [Oryza sativa Japonica Group]BAD69402.1 hypothetical protein [Oryza sativa Japonica Group]
MARWQRRVPSVDGGVELLLKRVAPAAGGWLVAALGGGGGWRRRLAVWLASALGGAGRRRHLAVVAGGSAWRCRLVAALGGGCWRRRLAMAGLAAGGWCRAAVGPWWWLAGWRRPAGSQGGESVGDENERRGGDEIGRQARSGIGEWGIGDRLGSGALGVRPSGSTRVFGRRQAGNRVGLLGWASILICPGSLRLASGSRASSSWLVISNELKCKLGSLGKPNEPSRAKPSFSRAERANEPRASWPALVGTDQ